MTRQVSVEARRLAENDRALISKRNAEYHSLLTWIGDPMRMVESGESNTGLRYSREQGAMSEYLSRRQKFDDVELFDQDRWSIMESGLLPKLEDTVGEVEDSRTDWSLGGSLTFLRNMSSEIRSNKGVGLSSVNNEGMRGSRCDFGEWRGRTVELGEFRIGRPMIRGPKGVVLGLIKTSYVPSSQSNEGGTLPDDYVWPVCECPVPRVEREPFCAQCYKFTRA